MSLHEINPASIGANTDMEVRVFAMHALFRHFGKLKGCDWSLAKPTLDHFSNCSKSEGFLCNFLSPACLNLGAHPDILPTLTRQIIVEELNRCAGLKGGDKSDHRLVFSDVAAMICRRQPCTKMQVLSPEEIDIIFATGIMIFEGMIPFYKELFQSVTEQISENLEELSESEKDHTKDCFLFLIVMRDIVALNELGQKVLLPTMRYALASTGCSSEEQHNQVLETLKKTEAGNLAGVAVNELFDFLLSKMKENHVQAFHDANGLSLSLLRDNLIDGWASCLLLGSDDNKYHSEAKLQSQFAKSVITFSQDLTEKYDVWFELSENYPNRHFFEEETTFIMKHKSQVELRTSERKRKEPDEWKRAFLTFLKKTRREVVQRGGKWRREPSFSSFPDNPAPMTGLQPIDFSHYPNIPRNNINDLPRGEVVQIFEWCGLPAPFVDRYFPNLGRPG